MIEVGNARAFADGQKSKDIYNVAGIQYDENMVPINGAVDPSTWKKQTKKTTTNPPFSPTLSGGNGGGGGGGADEAARQAEEMARQLKTAEDLVFASENQLRLLQEMTPIEELNAKAAVKKLEIQRDYADKLAESLSAEETLQLQLAEQNELKTVQLNLDKQMADLRESAIGSIDEEIKRLEAVIAGKEEEYKWEKMIADLKKNGVSPAEAEAKVNRVRELTAEAEAIGEIRSQYEQLAGGIASEMTNAFKGVIDGTKSVEQAFSDMLQGIADKFLDMAMKLIQDAITQQLMGLFANVLGGGIGGAGGGGGFGVQPLTSGLNFSGAFATGGVMPPNSTALVGENGPELISTGGAPARVTNNSQTDEMLNRYGASGGPMTMAPVQTSFQLQTTVINGVEYATVDQVRAMGQSATKQGAKLGEANAIKGLRNRRSTRQSLGI